MNKKTKQALALALGIAVLIALVYSGAFQHFGTIISVSEVQIRPEGYLEGNKIKGSYIVVTGVVQYSEDWQVLEFNNETLKEHPALWNGERVWVQNDIVVKFRPERPYYSREMDYKSQIVTPKAYRNYRTLAGLGKDPSPSVEPLYSQHWEFKTGDWVLHVPITLEIYVNNQKVTTKTLDLMDIEQMDLGYALNITTERGAIMVQSLGAFQSKYYPPEWDNIVFFSEKYFYLDSPTIQQALKCPYPYPSGGGSGTLTNYENSYAYYWFGGSYGGYTFDQYWTDDGTPCPYALDSFGKVSAPIPAEQAPGWVDPGAPFGVLERRDPVQPVKFPEEKWNLPTEKRGYYSLIEFLESRGAQKPLKPSWMASWSDMKVTLTQDPYFGYYSGRMYLYLPWSAFGHVLTVKIPTELADAVVEVPKLANIKIEEFPDDLGEIATDITVNLKLKQYADVVSDGIVEIKLVSPLNAYVAFNPSWFGTGSMAPNEEKNFKIQVVNLGSPDKVQCEGLITIKNSYGVQTDNKTFTFTLLPRQGDYSLLTVKVQDDQGMPVNGILVIVNYEQKSKQGYTTGGSVTFDFQGATPYVTISTQETSEYTSATVTYQMHTGYNEITLTVSHKGGNAENWDWVFWLALGSVIIIIISLIYKKRRAIFK